MTPHWPNVALAELLRPASRTERVGPVKEYALVGVRLNGKGPFHRETVLGSTTSATVLSRVQAGDFIYSRLFAWRGAFGVVGPELDGHYASGEFPTFLPADDRLDLNFLRLWFRLPSVLAQVTARSSGSTPTTRNRLREDQFLSLEIPLPPLELQRLTIKRLAEAERLIATSSRLFSDVGSEASALLSAEELRMWPESALGGAPTLRDVTLYLARGRQSQQGPSEHYLIKTQHVQMGRYVPTRVTLSPEAAARVDAAGTARSGDVLIACSAAGCLGRVAMFEDDRLVASTDTHVAIARPAEGVVLPEYLYAYLRSAQGQVQLRSRERGDWQRAKIGFRLTELNLRDLEQVPVPVPSLQDQRRIVTRVTELRRRIDEIEQHRQAQVHRLATLMAALLSQAMLLRRPAPPAAGPHRGARLTVTRLGTGSHGVRR